MGNDVLVYRYGCLAPTENGELVREQMHLAHRYRNTLVEIERGRRAALRALEIADSLSAEVAAACGEVDAARAAIKRARAITRSKSETEEAKARLALAKEKKKAAVDALYERRRRNREDPELQAERARINDLANELIRSARKYCGVYWGTYLLVEAAMESARAAPLFDGVVPNDPRFVGWRGEGAIGVQIQKGMDVEGVEEGEDARLRIVRELQPAKWSRRLGAELPPREVPVLWMRVGSDAQKKPIWARFPLVMHRPLPKDARVKQAAVSLRKIGPREEWACAITLDTSACAAKSQTSKEVVALNLGWRVMDDGIRLATWFDDVGRSGELRVPNEIVSALRKPSELRSVRDTNFNAARAALAAWLGEHEVPEWLRARTRTLAQWRSQARLASLARTWKEARFDGDAEGYEALEAWRYHDHHLWEWESSQRTKSLRRRRDFYRVFAADLANRYATVILETTDRSVLARKPDAEDTEEDIQSARSNRQLVAPSELEGAIVNAFGKARVTWLSSVNITVTCHACGVVERFDAARMIHYTCVSCGERWDQDVNAAKNLLGKWRERSGGDALPGSARDEEKQPSKRLQARRAGKERRKREAGAREADGNPAEGLPR